MPLAMDYDSYRDMPGAPEEENCTWLPEKYQSSESTTEAEQRAEHFRSRPLTYTTRAVSIQAIEIHVYLVLAFIE